MSLKRFFCLLILIIPCCVIGIIGYAIRGISSLSGCEESDPEQIEYLAQFELPPSAKNLESYCVGLQAYSADASFEMNPSELDTFITSTHIESHLFTEKSSKNEFLNSRLDKKASQMDSYLYGKYVSADFTQEILIDTSNSERYTVYIFAGGG